jgi:nucleoside-diphosphate-sugar epimerase
MRRRSISITGATGFLGWHLAEGFVRGGWRVRAIVRPGNRKPLPADVEVVETALDRSSATALARAFEYSSVVIHAAGVTRGSRESTFDGVNVEGTRAVVEAANDAGARLILISSQAAAGVGTTVRPRNESDEPQPVTAYGRSKLAGESIVRTTARVPWIILRPSAVYGPRDRQFLPLFRLASRGISPLVTGPETAFTLIHVDDVVRATVMAAEDDRGTGHTLFIGHHQPERTENILRCLSEAFDRPYRPRRVPSWLLEVASFAGELSWRLGKEPLIDRRRLVELRSAGFVCAVRSARDVLGFTAAIGLREGVAATAQWYRRQGWV